MDHCGLDYPFLASALVEPDLWNRHGYNITASEHAKDFTVLKELVEKEKPLGKLIVGPDVADNPLYFGL